ncbi:protein D2-like, partial [Gigantopelta aegis]|uniref:protein D2-like n=1 Tax=Gigantopelta aegis TaxID=1735272 RepID=UPI001B88BA83
LQKIFSQSPLPDHADAFIPFPSSRTEYINEKFKADGVVPDIIDIPPPKLLTIRYGSLEVVPGMTMTPTEVKDPPEVTFEAEAGSHYTLVMSGKYIDAPSRKDPKFGEWLHWCVVNIPGNNIGQGENIAEYVGAGPPWGTGPHRYVFLVFKQNGKKKFAEQKLTRHSGRGRANRKVRKFIKKHKLDELVAGNYFQAKFDNYVPLLHKQLGIEKLLKETLKNG